MREQLSVSAVSYCEDPNPGKTSPFFKGRQSFRWYVILVAVGASGAITLSSDEPWADILGLALLAGVAFLLGGFDLLHPYSWYVPFFFLYSVSVPLLVWVGELRDIGALNETCALQWVALSAFVVSVGPDRRPVSFSRVRVLPGVSVGAWIVFLFSFAISALYLLEIWEENLGSKYDIALAGSWLLRLDFSFSVLALAFSFLLTHSLMKGRFPWNLVLFITGWTSLGLFISGERDYVIRVVWISIFLWHVLYRPIKPPTVLAMACIGLAAVPVLGALKNLLLRRSPAADISLEDPIFLLLGDEFLTASKNLQVLVRGLHRGNFFLGETLWWDLRRAAIPGFLRPGTIDPTTWFNLEFYPSLVAHGGGQGFTLVGEGYMNFGVFGVIIWFVFLGLFVRFLYRKGSSSLTWLPLYVISMPLVLYVIRADLANLLSQFVKHIVLPWTFLALVAGVVKNLKAKKGL